MEGRSPCKGKLNAHHDFPETDVAGHGAAPRGASWTAARLRRFPGAVNNPGASTMATPQRKRRGSAAVQKAGASSLAL
jgi:hypothetical protein